MKNKKKWMELISFRFIYRFDNDVSNINYVLGRNFDLIIVEVIWMRKSEKLKDGKNKQSYIYAPAVVNLSRATKWITLRFVL